jgi:hypothetical protein
MFGFGPISSTAISSLREFIRLVDELRQLGITFTWNEWLTLAGGQKFITLSQSLTTNSVVEWTTQVIDTPIELGTFIVEPDIVFTSAITDGTQMW